MNRLKKCIILDEADNADRVLLWENNSQFKTVGKSRYIILQYPPYCDNII